MLRPKDRIPELIAALCGAAALIAYYAVRNDTIAVLALVVGVLVLAWSYLDVRR